MNTTDQERAAFCSACRDHYPRSRNWSDDQIIDHYEDQMEGWKLACTQLSGQQEPVAYAYPQAIERLKDGFHYPENMWGDAAQDRVPLYTAPQPVAPAAITDDLIRNVFIANGFTIKEGQADLKPYVYAAARALLKEITKE
jgi:hypothetical protein